MAMLLYRLGRWCATHAWRTIATWLALLTALGAGAATLGNPPTTKVSIADADFQRVYEKLGREIPRAAGGVGTVVLHSGSGAFSPDQVAAVRTVFADWKTIPHVKDVVDPFANQARADDGAAKLAAADTQIASGTKALAAARAKLEAGQGQLTLGRKVLADLRATNPKDPGIPPIAAQVAAGARQLAAGETQYAAGKARLDAAAVQVAQGKAQTAAMGGLRFVTRDGYALVQVQFDDNVNSIPPEVRQRITARAEPVLKAAGVMPRFSVEITQELKVIGPGEIIGLTVALIVLVVMLGSLIAAGLPIAVALLGVGTGLAGAMALTHFYEMNALTPALALMLGLAVGIDYALFIVNRHRGQLLHGMPMVDSIGRAVGTAGNAVIFAGSTVVIALAALVISGIPILAQMGFIAAGTVATVVLVAVTLTPAILGLMKTRVVSRRTWRAHGFAVPGDPTSVVGEHAGHPEEDPDEEHGAWYVRLVTRRPWLTILGVVATVAVLAIPALDLRLGLPDGSSEPHGSTAYQAYSDIDEHFGPGLNGPVVAVVGVPAGTSTDRLAELKTELSTSFGAMSGVAHVVPFGESADHDTLAFQIVPDSGPSQARTVETVSVIKDSGPALEQLYGVTVGVTGQTVANIEISQRLGGALPLYLLVVVGLSLLILTVVFRSVVVPLLATLGFLLSVAAAFGATVAVYQWGWFGSVLGVSTPGPIMSFTPTLLVGVLFGLAMDYQMFLVSGMHEAHSHGEDARTAVRTGFTHGVKVVTAAAVIMFSVFFGFVFSHLNMVRPIGLSLAVGVLVDAFLVRMTLTPALMHLFGERAWFLPRRLERSLPDLDVEGTTLSAHLASQGTH